MELFERVKTICKVWLFIACVLQTDHFATCANNSSFIGGKNTIYIWSSERYFNSSDKLAVKVGAPLAINCSIDRTANNTSILWKASNLFSISQRNDTFIQCGIDKVTWELNGTVFWCGYRQRTNGTTASQEGKEITIIVGDTPSPPRSPTYTIHDITLFRIKITWKPAIYTGRLPAHYDVKYTPCYNQSYCPDSQQVYLFCRRPHVNEQEEFHCEMRRDDLMILLSLENLFDIFRFTLVTANDVGKSNATSLIVDAGFGGEAIFMPTPLPPKGLRAEALSSHQILVTWQPKKYTQSIYDITYIVLYHAEKSRHNETKELIDTDSVTLMDGIVPFTKYQIYLMVKVTSDENKIATSDTVGPVNVMTSEGEPKQGPAITRQKSVLFPSNHNIRNITLNWKSPPESSWQGKPSKITIHYREKDNHNISDKKVISITNKIPLTATITGLKSGTAYGTYLNLCNDYSCGGMGPETTIEPIYNNESVSVHHNNIEVPVAIGIVVVGAAIIASIAALICFKKRKRVSTLLVPLDTLVPQDLVAPDYAGLYSEPSHPTEPNYTQLDNNSPGQGLHDSVEVQQQLREVLV